MKPKTYQYNWCSALIPRASKLNGILVTFLSGKVFRKKVQINAIELTSVVDSILDSFPKF